MLEMFSWLDLWFYIVNKANYMYMYILILIWSFYLICKHGNGCLKQKSLAKLVMALENK